jgi:hypothetical protein
MLYFRNFSTGIETRKISERMTVTAAPEEIPASAGGPQLQRPVPGNSRLV